MLFDATPSGCKHRKPDKLEWNVEKESTSLTILWTQKDTKSIAKMKIHLESAWKLEIDVRVIQAPTAGSLPASFSMAWRNSRDKGAVLCAARMTGSTGTSWRWTMTDFSWQKQKAGCRIHESWWTMRNARIKSQSICQICLSNTLPETNTAPESLGLEDVYDFLLGPDLLVLVLGRVQGMEHIQISPPSQTFLGELRCWYFPQMTQQWKCNGHERWIVEHPNWGQINHSIAMNSDACFKKK